MPTDLPPIPWEIVYRQLKDLASDLYHNIEPSTQEIWVERFELMASIIEKQGIAFRPEP
jgi:hypothetical protein